MTTLAAGAVRGGPEESRLSFLGSTLWTKAHDIEIRGDRAYCAFLDGLMVLDLTDPKVYALLARGETRGDIAPIVGDSEEDHRWLMLLDALIAPSGGPAGKTDHVYGDRGVGGSSSPAAVAGYLAANFDRLAGRTRLWRDTWYDSTLPYWLLDRTFANTSTLATSTCHWFANGRFYGWEGVGCCAGTCAHVWHYAHSVARLFPELERSARLWGDYGAGFQLTFYPF